MRINSKVTFNVFFTLIVLYLAVGATSILRGQQNHLKGRSSEEALLQLLTNSSSESRPILVDPFNFNGVTLSDANSSEFIQKAPQIAPNQFWSSIQPLLSSSVLLANNSDKPILGYAICWEGIGPDGSPQRGYKVSFDTVRLEGVLMPGAAEVVSLLGPSTFAQSIPSQTLLSERDKHVAWLAGLSAPTVRVDSIILSDGSVAGRDRSRLFLRMKAVVQAERELLKQVTSGVRSEVDMLAWLKEQGDFKKMLVRSKESKDYFTARYALEWTQAAHDLLQIASHNGTRLMIEGAAKTLVDRKYPKFFVAGTSHQ